MPARLFLATVLATGAGAALFAQAPPRAWDEAPPRAWCDDQAPQSAPVPWSYAEQKARAERERRPLLVWVGCAPQVAVAPGALHCACQSFPGVTGPAIVVSRPHPSEGWMEWRATLPAAASAPAIRDVLADAPAPVVVVPPPVWCVGGS